MPLAFLGAMATYRRLTVIVRDGSVDGLDLRGLLAAFSK